MYAGTSLNFPNRMSEFQTPDYVSQFCHCSPPWHVFTPGSHEYSMLPRVGQFRDGGVGQFVDGYRVSSVPPDGSLP
jgi:hypothetical protein